MAAKRKRTMEDKDIAHKRFLDSDSDAHTSDNELSHLKSDSDQERETVSI
jgi:hypothetical protein